MTCFRWFSKNVASFSLWTNVALALVGLVDPYVYTHYSKCKVRICKKGMMVSHYLIVRKNARESMYVLCSMHDLCISFPKNVGKISKNYAKTKQNNRKIGSSVKTKERDRFCIIFS